MDEMGAVLAELRALRELVREQRNRPLLLTMRAAGEMMSVSSRTVKRMVSRGELATVRSGLLRRVLVPTEEVERWVRDNSVVADNRQKKRGKSEADKIRALARG